MAPSSTQDITIQKDSGIGSDLEYDSDTIIIANERRALSSARSAERRSGDTGTSWSIFAVAPGTAVSSINDFFPAPVFSGIHRLCAAERTARKGEIFGICAVPDATVRKPRRSPKTRFLSAAQCEARSGGTFAIGSIFPPTLPPCGRFSPVPEAAFAGHFFVVRKRATRKDNISGISSGRITKRASGGRNGALSVVQAPSPTTSNTGTSTVIPRRYKGEKYLPGTSEPVDKQWWVDDRSVGWWSKRPPPGFRPAELDSMARFVQKRRREARVLADAEHTGDAMDLDCTVENDAQVTVALTGDDGDDEATDIEDQMESTIPFLDQSRREREEAHAKKLAAGLEKQRKAERKAARRQLRSDILHEIAEGEETFQQAQRDFDRGEIVEWRPPGSIRDAKPFIDQH